MSLLLDALKKAALEKQRREHSADIIVPDDSATEPAKHLLAVVPPSAALTPADLHTEDARAEKVAHQSSAVAEVEHSLATLFNAELEKPVHPGAGQIAHADEADDNPRAEPVFIDIGELDFAAAVGFVPLVEDAQSTVQPAPVTLAIDEPLHELGDDIPDDTPVPIQPSTEEQSKEPSIGNELIDKESVSEVVSAGAQADIPVAKFNDSAAKQSLAALLKNSQAAANTARRRLVSMYSILLLTAVALVGYYYFLLHLNEPTVMAVNVGGGSVPPSVEVAPDLVADGKGDGEASAAISPEPHSSQSDVATIATQAAAPEAEAPLISDRQKLPASAISLRQGVVYEGAAPTSRPAQPVALAIKDASEQQAGRSESGRAQPVVVYQKPAPDILSEAVERGYRAYQDGDLASARLAYGTALAQDPHHRDALLGAAGVALQQGRVSEALNFYQRQLARAPKDEYAQAGILALSAQAEPNPQLDSEVSRLLRDYPEAAHLHYLQGTLYAQRQQWAAAQLAFFAAWQRDNKNPDVLCNLAIALDHLEQPKEAARFYRQALTLSASRKANFSAPAISQRLQELEGAAAAGAAR